VKHDLQSGGHRIVGGPPQVRALAWEWVRVKEDQQRNDLQETARALGLEATTPAGILRVLGLPAAAASEQAGSAIDTAEIMKASAASMERAIRQTGSAPAPAGADQRAATREQRELLILKPTFMGMGVDLKELGRRLSSVARRHLGKSP
jgi:hypothetical protein